MYLILYLFMIMLFICNLIMYLSIILSKKKFFDREKNSSFECGFNPSYFTRMPFSMHFYLIAVIFLIFDVEITILLPLFYTMNNSNMIIFITISFFFLTILFLGLIHEWNQKILNWSL
uniref:NADH-ubiquinone oxidoreductase chain 3 n=1 Tax=Kisaura zhejiangensis (nom. nud.) TaxID=2904921 RepID=A0A9E8LNY3_9NEOP|nr:NADH dehydrogenase subunit 3 [Kisaura zhejiangensis (nom. nud.)]UZZ44071.1 NADH dehydrogenase subunit 3 [Kisaura zhejiangensis (nom. nud.)]